jgi:transcriptional regulator with XRE-family HTH domain
MTQTFAEPQPTSSSVAERLRRARADAGLTLVEAAKRTGLLRSYIAALEAGRRRPLPREVDRLAGAYDADLSDLLPARQPVEVVGERIVVAGQSRLLRDAADDREVYAAYLFLLYAVRGATPGQRVPLRSSDVELLMQVVGEDAETIERRLVELMGCSPGEATMLGSVLLRHRALTAAAGAAAALSWGAVAAPRWRRGGPASGPGGATPLSGARRRRRTSTSTPSTAGVAPPVEDVVDGEWSPSYPGCRRRTVSRGRTGSDSVPSVLHLLCRWCACNDLRASVRR